MCHLRKEQIQSLDSRRDGGGGTGVNVVRLVSTVFGGGGRLGRRVGTGVGGVDSWAVARAVPALSVLIPYEPFLPPATSRALLRHLHLILEPLRGD